MTSSTINPDTLHGVEVTGSHGSKLGKVDHLYIDNDTNQPEWVAVKSGLFGTHVSLVPISKAQFDGTVLNVPFDKEQLKTAPHHDPTADLSPQAEQDLYEHYGLSYTPHSGSPATDPQHSKPAGRLRKHAGTKNITKTVPVSREKVRLEREPATHANANPDAMSGWVIIGEEHEVTVLSGKAVVIKETVVLERMLLGIDTVTDGDTLTDVVPQEHIDEPKTDTH